MNIKNAATINTPPIYMRVKDDGSIVIIIDDSAGAWWGEWGVYYGDGDGDGADCDDGKVVV